MPTMTTIVNMTNQFNDIVKSQDKIIEKIDEQIDN